MKVLWLYLAIFVFTFISHRTGYIQGHHAGQLESQTEKYTVTAYCPKECCCGEWADGYFANGEPVGGLAIAAPKSIPFDTVLFVPGYGTATVKDRGGSIKGNKLDVYFPTHQEALDWGVQYLTVLEME